jgi:coiled-coil domain-containing protein 77
MTVTLFLNIVCLTVAFAYRQKVAEYDDEYLSLIKKFETLRSSQEEQIKVENDLHQRENEIHELQKAMSDLQVFLMQEREHVIRLYSENDRLKLQQFEDSKKIQVVESEYRST